MGMSELRRQLMTDLDNAREAWGAIHRRMLTNASLATSKALEGLILQSADETGDLISDLLARVENMENALFTLMKEASPARDEDKQYFDFLIDGLFMLEGEVAETLRAIFLKINTP